MAPLGSDIVPSTVPVVLDWAILAVTNTNETTANTASTNSLRCFFMLIGISFFRDYVNAEQLGCPLLLHYCGLKQMACPLWIQYLNHVNAQVSKELFFGKWRGFPNF